MDGNARQTGEWFWWSGFDGEKYDGPFKTREAAIANLDGERGYVCEARQDPLMFSDWLDMDLIFDHAEDRMADNNLVNEDGDSVFEVSDEQAKDLADRLKRACNEWQAAHGLVFVPWSFTEIRNKAVIEEK